MEHNHDEIDECVVALNAVHAFLHDELEEVEADMIRVHLHACERCMENFEIEQTITEMIRRSQRGPEAPAALRASLTRIVARRRA